MAMCAAIWAEGVEAKTVFPSVLSSSGEVVFEAPAYLEPPVVYASDVIGLERCFGEEAKHKRKGGYRPRVTVETQEGPLFSSDAFALSLDVVSDANQKDPKGGRPIGAANDFKEAVLAGKRDRIERLLGYNPRLTSLLLENPYALNILQDIYRKSQNWKVQDWGKDGRASVSYTFEVNGTTYGGGLELRLISPQLYSGREWVIDFIY